MGKAGFKGGKGFRFQGFRFQSRRAIWAFTGIGLSICPRAETFTVKLET
jgi:hypothetical protein